MAEAKKIKALFDTYTLTFGDQAENHVGMQKLGKLAAEGFSLQDLQEAKQRFEDDGYKCELVRLDEVVKGTPEAAVLIIRDGVRAFVDPDEMYDEQAEVEYDTTAFMYGRVVTKRARGNVCFAEYSQEPDIPNKKGRVVAFKDVPLLDTVQKDLPGYLGEKAANLHVEGNHYTNADPNETNPNKACGIGFHGDAERKKVIAVRLGNTLPLHYQWFKDGVPVGERVVLSIEHGDMYVMSEKATGWDWKKKKVYTLRHAAGARLFTNKNYA